MHIKRILAAALCAVGMWLSAAPLASASSIQAQTTAAYQWTTYTCLRYTGCGAINLNQIDDNGRGCHSWHYNYHTTYYGWRDGWTPWFC